MRNWLKFKLLPVLAGLFTAFIIMVVFEYANSLFYPLPESLDKYDAGAVRDFTATLPWTAYVLVLLGWIVGSFKAGLVTTYLAKEQTYLLSLIVGTVLTGLGIMNNILIGHSLFFNVVGLPMFFVFTYLGHRYMRKFITPRPIGSVAVSD